MCVKIETKRVGAVRQHRGKGGCWESGVQHRVQGAEIPAATQKPGAGTAAASNLHAECPCTLCLPQQSSPTKPEAHHKKTLYLTPVNPTTMTV